MATNSTVVRRYAKALFSVTNPESYDEVERMLTSLAEAWQTVPALREGLTNPQFPADERREALLELARRRGAQHDQVLRLIGLLFQNNRLKLLPELAAFFRELVFEYRRLLSLTVTTAHSLEHWERDEMYHQLRSRLGKDLVVDWSVDPTLLGGARVRVADKVLDGSVQGMLERAARSLL